MPPSWSLIFEKKTPGFRANKSSNSPAGGFNTLTGPFWSANIPLWNANTPGHSISQRKPPIFPGIPKHKLLLGVCYGMFQKYVGKFWDVFFQLGSRLGAVGWKRFIFIIPKSCQYPPKKQSTKWCFEQAALWKTNTCDTSNYGFIFLPKFGENHRSTVKMAPQTVGFLFIPQLQPGVDCRAISYSQLSYNRKLDRFFSSLSGGGPGIRHISGPRGFFTLIPGVLNNRYTVEPLLDYKWAIIPTSVTPISKVITPISGA